MPPHLFRGTLDAWRQGAATQDDVEHALVGELAEDPRLLPVVRSLIEAYRQAGHIPIPFAERLMFLQSGKEIPRAPAAVGSLLANQYVLEKIVPGGASGGMGVVFKARDLIQEEALDRNPFVAIKIFNDRFKRHPDSMTALHREYKKALQLSHPHIVKMQNFNRDGADVFIVMELLEGQPLSDVIAADRTQELPRREALRIIMELTRALAYAHQLRIVHSDFKPSNAFVTRDGNIKVLDFGIARAVKRHEASGGEPGRTGEWTHFDPATAGEYTSLYASCEQIGGADPDPRDDVYALSVVAYELLTGRHPFDRKDAAQARHLGLKAQAVPGLSRRQWHTLQAGLSFAREQRPADAAAFCEGMTLKERPVKLIIAGAAAFAVIAVAIVIMTAGWLERRESQGIVAALNSTDPKVANDAVKRLSSTEDTIRETVLSQEGTKTKVFAVYERQARELFDPQRSAYDYAAAQAILARARAVLPDYEPLGQLADTLARSRTLRLQALHDDFERALGSRASLQDEGPTSLPSLRREIAAIEPNDPSLRDSRVPLAFRDAAVFSLDRGELDAAERLVRTGLLLSPADLSLRDVEDRVRHARERRTMVDSLGDLQSMSIPLQAPGATLADFHSDREQLLQLRALAPDDAGLARAVARLQPLVRDDIASQLAQQTADRAQIDLDEWQILLDPSFVRREQAQIAKVIGGSRSKELQAADDRRLMNSLLAAPEPTDEWVAKLHTVLLRLDEVAPLDPAVAEGYGRARLFLLDSAKSLRSASRFSEAERLLRSARLMGATDADIHTEAEALAQAQARIESDNKNKILEAERIAQKQRVVDLASAGGSQLDAAYDLYQRVSKTLPADDSWVAGPRALADGYLLRAQVDAKRGQFAAAKIAALRVRNLPLTDPFYQDQVAFFERLVDLQTRLQTGDLGTAASMTDQLKRLQPILYDELEPQLVRIVAERIHRLAVSHPDQAGGLARQAHDLFPHQSIEAQ